MADTRIHFVGGDKLDVPLDVNEVESALITPDPFAKIDLSNGTALIRTETVTFVERREHGFAQFG